VEAYDDTVTRLSAGTIGLWSYHKGSKYWDDLLVEPVTASLTNRGLGVANVPTFITVAGSTSNRGSE
jgi:hypothetical protein